LQSSKQVKEIIQLGEYKKRQGINQPLKNLDSLKLEKKRSLFQHGLLLKQVDMLDQIPREGVGDRER
jgi:hypothetical protein